MTPKQKAYRARLTMYRIAPGMYQISNYSLIRRGQRSPDLWYIRFKGREISGETTYRTLDVAAREVYRLIAEADRRAAGRKGKK